MREGCFSYFDYIRVGLTCRPKKRELLFSFDRITSNPAGQEVGGTDTGTGTLILGHWDSDTEPDTDTEPGPQREHRLGISDKAVEGPGGQGLQG